MYVPNGAIEMALVKTKSHSYSCEWQQNSNNSNCRFMCALIPFGFQPRNAHLNELPSHQLSVGSEGGRRRSLQFANKVAIGYYNFPVTAFLQSSQKKKNYKCKQHEEPHQCPAPAACSPLWRSTSAPTSRTENFHNVRSTVVAKKKRVSRRRVLSSCSVVKQEVPLRE